MKIEKLKEKAREHEQEERWMEAMGLYSRALAQSTEEEEPDIALHNRIGDLQIRIGDLEGAVENYETAIDLYLEADLPNNAMAVCRKLERNAPGRPSVLLRMGQIRIRQGFVVDAREDFLSYAEVQLAQGDADEALRALEEFARLAPDDVEIRLFLAEQLRASDRPDDAVGHLGTAYRSLRERGDEERAEAILDQITELDPSADRTDLEAASADAAERETGGYDSAPAEDGFVGFQSTALGDIALDEPEEEVPAPVDDDGADADDAPDGGVRLPGEREDPGPPVDEAPEVDDPLAGTVFDLGASGEDPDESSPVDPTPSAFDIAELDREDPLEVDEEDLDPLPTLGAEEEEEGLDLDPLPTLGDDEEEEPLPGLGADGEELAMDSLSTFTGEGAEGDPDPLPSLDDEEDRDGPESDGPSSEQETAGADEPRALTESPQPPDGPLGEGTGDGTPDDADGPLGPEASLRELASRVRARPDDADAWRQLGVRLLEEGEDHRARQALERAHAAYAEAGDPELAMRVVRELIFHEPEVVDHYQRLVEYAHRTRDRALLVPAFLELAEALERTGAHRKAEVVYGQVLALDPRNPRARRALAVGTAPESSAERKETRSGKFVDLGDMVLDEAAQEQTFRWRVDDADPSGDEEADFAKMLSRFKEKVASGMPADDATAHYDLGAAYKDMGLVDEAIGQFQRTLRARPDYLPAFEMVGQCFLEKGEPKLAVRTLARALKVEPQVEDEFLGIYYYLAKAHEAAGNPEEAREFYERVFSLDINFMDVTERLRVLR